MKKIEQLPPLFSLNPLEQRIADITRVIEEKKKDLENAPEGNLRIAMHGNSPQYYFRHKSKDKNGVYLSKPNESLVHTLAQKAYDKKILKALSKEKVLLEELLSQYKNFNPEDVILCYAAARRKLINPVTLPVDEYFIKWRPETLPKNPFPEKPSFQTASGVYVRSKSEVMIADTLFKKNIPFLYENPIEIGKRTFYPDFTCIHPLSHKVIIWEHFGMMDNQEYANSFAEKINAYEGNNYFPGNNMIYTFETSKLPLTPQRINKTVNAYFK